jgi:hypothetical protein
MALLDTTTVNAAFQGIKGAIIEAVKQIPGAGKVHNRLRYAADVPTWLEIAAVERVAGVDVIRCAFIYYASHESHRVEGCKRLYTVTFGLEIVQAFEDGTDEDSSTSRYETFIADLTQRFDEDEDLGFTEGNNEARHTGLQGGEGEGRPALVDGVFSHRKVLTLAVQFKR